MKRGIGALCSLVCSPNTKPLALNSLNCSSTELLRIEALQRQKASLSCRCGDRKCGEYPEQSADIGKQAGVALLESPGRVPWQLFWSLPLLFSYLPISYHSEFCVPCLPCRIVLPAVATQSCYWDCNSAARVEDCSTSPWEQ